MRIGAVLLVILSLAACNRGVQSNDAVRQGVIDHLAGVSGLSVANMDITVSSVKFNGEEADAAVSIAPKGGNPSAGMSINYHLKQQGNKWVVVGRQDSSANPHGGGAMPGAANPHGGAMPGAEGENPHGGAVPGGSGSKMPSPEDLPPTGKNK